MAQPIKSIRFDRLSTTTVEPDYQRMPSGTHPALVVPATAAARVIILNGQSTIFPIAKI